MKPLVIANWKMNPTTLVKAKQLFNSLEKGLRNNKKVEVVICPSFIYISSFKFQVSGFKLGAQDCFWEKEGAYTGEISPEQLLNLDCQYVIVGHSERRRYFKETDEIINKKLKAAVKAKLNPILCIGETQEQRNRGETDRILRKQIESALKNVSSLKFQNSRFCIAYEPVWAIGTGKPCDVEETQKMSLLIRKIVTNLYNSLTAKRIRILYGGSINIKNATDYTKEAHLQGLLVGGASLNAKEFIKIVKVVI